MTLFRPTRDWIEATYKVELEEPEETEAPPAVAEAPVEGQPAPETPAEGETPVEGAAPGDEELDSLIDEIFGNAAG